MGSRQPIAEPTFVGDLVEGKGNRGNPFTFGSNLEKNRHVEQQFNDLNISPSSAAARVTLTRTQQKLRPAHKDLQKTAKMKKRKCILFLNFFILIFVSPSFLNASKEKDTVVAIKPGKVRGFYLPTLSESVIAYLGIPYGEAPTGTQRFKKPEPRKPWKGIYEATKYGKSCYQKRDEAYASFPGTNMWQVNNEMSEDCLYLNVWVPSSKPKSAHVMVFIYGGAFLAGTSSLEIYDPSILAFSEDIIVVSMNYRVGALGFLALPGNRDIPGNAGMFDQQLALQWVYENIAAFGGNPDSITLFGHSSGAACVGLHLLSPGSQNYIKRVILQSGSVSAPWAINTHKRAKRLTLKLAELLACSVNNETEMVDCLQNTHPTKIVEQQFFVETVHPLALTRIIPIVDFDFISDTPTNIIRRALKKTDILIGGTKDDGNPFTIWGAPGFSRNHESLITSEELINGIRRFFPTAGDLGTESILFEYKDWEDEHSKMKNREAMELILRDYYMICPMEHFAGEISKHKVKIYFYEFDHRSSQEVWPEWMGVLHGAILPFMFGKALIEERNFTEAEQRLSKRVMRAWANFARNGTPHVDEDNFTWPPYSTGDENYVVLKTGAWDIKSKLYSKRCQFWNSLLPKLVREVGKSFDGNLWTDLAKKEQACYSDGLSAEEFCQEILD
ncbi:cholinesterase-like [Gastrophryne carolinensis]